MMVLIRETWTRAMLWRYAYRNISIETYLFAQYSYEGYRGLSYIKYEDRIFHNISIFHMVKRKGFTMFYTCI